MKEIKKNEELQSRREFFKKAAKSALPVIAAVALASVPTLTQASEAAMGCQYGCNGSCQGCRTTCTGCSGCGGYCRTNCSSGCQHSLR